MTTAQYLVDDAALPRRALEEAYRPVAEDLSRALRRVPMLAERSTIAAADALLAGRLPEPARLRLEAGFKSGFSAARILHTANILNAFFRKDDFRGRRVLELGPGQFCFALLARSLGAAVTTADRNEVFFDVARELAMPILDLEFYSAAPEAVGEPYDGVWLKGAFSALAPGEERGIESFASKLDAWIAPGGWGYVAPNNRAEKFARKLGTGALERMAALIEHQRRVFEALGWTAHPLDEEGKALFGMASKAYDASRYIFLKNLLPHRTGR